MANTNNAHYPPALEHEDEEALNQSVSQQWTILSHLLHLPSQRELANQVNHRPIAENIANQILRIRGNIADRGGFADLLNARFHERHLEEQHAYPQQPPQSQAGRALEAPGAAAARSWLKVIYENIGEAEIRGLANEVRANAIRPVNGTHVWRSTIVVGTNNYQIDIDLRHPVWANGNPDEIRRKMENQHPDHTGVVITPLSGGVIPTSLDATWVNSIMSARTRIIDPQPALSRLNLLHTVHPVLPPNTRVEVDMPALIQQHPNAGKMNAAQLSQFFQKNPAVYQQFVQWFDATTGNAIVRNTPADMDAVSNAAFDAMAKPRTQPLLSIDSELSAAIGTRSTIDRLTSTTTDSRELMLALAMIQQDPQAGHSLVVTSHAEQIQQQIRENDRLQYYALIAKDLQNAEIPRLNEMQINEGEQVMNMVIHNAQTVINTIHTLSGQPRNLRRGLNISQEAIADQANIARNDIVVAYDSGNPPNTPASSNADVFRTEMRKAQDRLSYFRSERDKIDNVVNVMRRACHVFNAHQIPQLDPNIYPFFTQHINRIGNVFHLNENGVRADASRINLRMMNVEYRQALSDANPTNRIHLNRAEYYENRDRELHERLQEEQQKVQAVPEGSDACWAIIRRGLEDQGIRGDELENTIHYMRAQVQRRPAAMRNLQVLANAEFPYDGEDDDRAKKQYNEGKVARTWGHPFKNNPYEEYTQGLFTTKNIGLGLGEGKIDLLNEREFDPRQRQYALPQLLHVYFRTKYLLNLPASDPRHLPESKRILNFMRNLHQAILDRAQESFGKASGMSNQAMQQLRQMGLEIDPKELKNMSMTEKMEAVQLYLHSGEGYYDQYKGTIEKIADRAYRRIREAQEQQDRRVAKRQAIIGGTKRGIRSTAKWIGNTFVGNGSPYNPLTWPGKTVKATWRNKGSIAAGALIGTLFLPGLGTAIGAAVAPMIKKAGASTSAH